MDVTPGKRKPLDWVSRDGKLLIGVRGVRTFAHSAASVLLAIYLDLLGFSLVEIGLFLTIGSAGAAFWALIGGLVGDAVGRRRLLTVMGLLMALTGIALITAQSFALLAAAAFLGSFSALAGASGAMGPLEQASLPTAAAPERRTDLFALYGIVGSVALALGALAAGVPAVLEASIGLDQIGSFRIVFAGYVALGLVIALMYSRLSAQVEVPEAEARWRNPLRMPSRSRMLTLAGLFTVDSFGTGMMGQSLAAYWFFTRFGLLAEELGLVFFASNVLTAISLWVAARLASRIGLVNTMVFTHIPSSLVLIVIPFVPDAGWAIALWLIRAFCVQMDAPTSQSYTMAVVGPEERSAMATATTVSRSSGVAMGPVATTALWSAASASAPFVVGGVVKIAYDLTLWFLFRRIKPPEEERGDRSG